MSIAYKIEFDNSKKVNFSEMISEIFDGLMNCGQENKDVGSRELSV